MLHTYMHLHCSIMVMRLYAYLILVRQVIGTRPACCRGPTGWCRPWMFRYEVVMASPGSSVLG